MTFEPMIMGVLNVTPDSFSDGGCFLQQEDAIRRAIAIQTEGADVIDIGGASARPGAEPVSVQEELDRLMPVLEKLKQALSIRISVDTTQPEVMREVLRLGVWMVNDIHALQTPGALSLLADAPTHVCLMHMQGQPKSMQLQPIYHDDVVREVSGFLKNRVDVCLQAGIEPARLWIDPGIGFGKTKTHNLLLLKRVHEFSTLGFPLMVGVSRKSLLGQVVNQPVESRMPAGLAVAVYLWMQGVKMIRTHDVRATKEAVLMLQAIQEV